jgi:hypothetical protein
MNEDREHGDRNRNREKCQNLLEHYKKSYSVYIENEQKYYDDLKKWQNYQNKQVENFHRLNQFEQSQAIEFNDRIFNCSSTPLNFNKETAADTNTNLNTMLKCVAEKCKCQQLFMVNRQHLQSIYNSNPTPVIDYEYCQQKGYLSNNNIHEKSTLCLKHIQENIFDCQCMLNQNQMEIEQQPIIQPIQPILYLPTNTCGQCKQEFDNLALNFSYDNVQAVQNCINNIDNINNHNKNSNWNDKNIGGGSDISAIVIKDKNDIINSSDSDNNNDSNKSNKNKDKNKDEDDLNMKMNNIDDEKNRNQIWQLKNLKLSRPLMVLVAIILFVLVIFSFFIAFSLLKNIPYDLPCTKIGIIQQSDLNNSNNKNKMEIYNQKIDIDERVKYQLQQFYQ